MIKMASPITEKRWQCVSCVLDGSSAEAATPQEYRTLLQSTMKVCRVLPVGLTADSAARALQLEAALPQAARWKLD